MKLSDDPDYKFIVNNIAKSKSRQKRNVHLYITFSEEEASALSELGSQCFEGEKYEVLTLIAKFGFILALKVVEFNGVKLVLSDALLGMKKEVERKLINSLDKDLILNKDDRDNNSNSPKVAWDDKDEVDNNDKS